MPKRNIIGVSRPPKLSSRVFNPGMESIKIGLSTGVIYELRIEVRKGGKLRARYPHVPVDEIYLGPTTENFELGWRAYFMGLKVVEPPKGVDMVEFMEGFRAADDARQVERKKQAAMNATRKRMLDLDYRGLEERVLGKRFELPGNGHHRQLAFKRMKSNWVNAKKGKR